CQMENGITILNFLTAMTQMLQFVYNFLDRNRADFERGFKLKSVWGYIKSKATDGTGYWYYLYQKLNIANRLGKS
ncbi:MAG: hypothetical protein V8R81_07505, partial [Clostridia bacterium]